MNNDELSLKATYLQMIQSSIERMATTSAVFKGFCATIIAGISAISFSEINKWVLLLSISSVICFFLLDVYYLQLEKRFRALYNMVRTDQHVIDFDLMPPKAKELRYKDVGILYCLKSPSIYLFYLPAAAISIAVLCMKFKGVM